MLFLRKVFQCFFYWRLNLPAWSNEAQVLCACTFGRGDDTCNAAIAAHIVIKALQYNIPYCVQAEIAQHLDSRLSGYCSAESFDTHCDGYIGTNETVQEQVEQYLRPRGITKIHVEAQPEHAWRVVMCYQHLGVNVVSLCTSDKPYPTKSAQTWCRSKLRFVPYEVLARLLYLAKGYI